MDVLPPRQLSHLCCNIHMNPSLVSFFQQMWLSQANWCFDRFLSSAVDGVLDESFYLLDSVRFTIIFEYPEEIHEIQDWPYLFLNRPTGDLVDGRFFARIPPLEELFYWAVDPDGVRKLNASSVERLRLPRLICRTVTLGDSWTAAHYQALREVHKAKGFDPDSPDVAISLGYPLLTPNDPSRLEECGDNDTQCVLV
ncbi:hypothetical protein DFH06DRAFT_144167 [Mycena polygramma]|nr:hypothetical protein DFH06DRAFT_144167 [Mycena polygramma]